MVIPSNTSLLSLIDSVFRIYEEALQRDFQEVMRSDGPTGERIRFLRDLKDSRIAGFNGMSINEIQHFFKLFLDCHALASATQSYDENDSGMVIRDISRLGTTRNRRGVLMQDNPDQIEDWYFALYIQGWAITKGIGQLNDLRFDNKFRRVKVCDYMFYLKNDDFELLECKRIHPNKPIENIVDDIIQKITTGSPIHGISQFHNTEGILGKRSACRHILIDISAYNGNIYFEEKIKSTLFQATGFRQDEIDEIVSRLSATLPDGLDKITLCWNSVFFANTTPYAIIQQTYSFSCSSQGASSGLDYQGWTIEGFPHHTEKSKLKHMAVSTIARSLDYLKARYANYMDPDFLKFGPEESAQETREIRGAE